MEIVTSVKIYSSTLIFYLTQPAYCILPYPRLSWTRLLASFNIGQLLRLLTVFGRHTSRIDSEDRRRRPMAKIED